MTRRGFSSERSCRSRFPAIGGPLLSAPFLPATIAFAIPDPVHRTG